MTEMAEPSAPVTKRVKLKSQRVPLPSTKKEDCHGPWKTLECFGTWPELEEYL